MYDIHQFHREAMCQLSGKRGEAVEVSSREHGLDHAVLSVRELVKLMRFHDLQANHNHLPEDDDGITE